ncbi:uncharacterized protein LOC129219330 [Uloborus diversus]|uniref:uncharacterized protein LOC129219330 n=1 Tax=Uloborus diversus TaxID=327109 RepID=UPI002409CE78|nr:uncharacterized protein LOC129219330 [Uloborus diversus]
MNVDQPKKASMKLPKIPLPTFSGKFEEWNLFKTQFNSLINENPELSESEKLHYLRGSLKGEAKILETTDDSFSSLFKALEQRDENKRIIVDCHINNILNIQPIKHESAKDLRIILDNVKKNLRSLKLLDFARDKLSNAILLNVVLEKLDRETRKQYELTLKDKEVPDFDALLEFLERRCQILNSISANISCKSKSFIVKSNNISKICVACKTQTHQLYHCDKFKAMKLSERIDLVKKYRLCFNCLSDRHLVSQCNSKSSCFVCKKKLNHHTLLHKYVNCINSRQNNADCGGSTGTPQIQSQGLSQQQNISNSEFDSQMSENTRVSFFFNGNEKTVLINTVIVYVRNSTGIRRGLRAILDCASESSFISVRAAEALGLKRERINIPISGLNDSALNIKKKISAHLSNKGDDSHWEIDLLIVPKITDFTPSKKINIAHLNIPNDVCLADPAFYIPQKVDILLGAELFFAFLKADKRKLKDNLYLQSSCFGYLVSGSISDSSSDHSAKHCFLSKNLETLNITLTNFWEIEEVENHTPCSDDELNYCNEHFAKTHFRNSDGRYVVQMPFKPDCSEIMLGNSKQTASRRLDQLWKRLERDPAMKARYTEFLNEYKTLNHMKEIKEDKGTDVRYYLPHHGIFRPDSKTTKLRVVFNASAKTTSGHSLNDLLSKGGVIQEDLFSILIRFRKYIYAFTTDIKQMFRMIEVDSSQTKLQKILWKESEFAPTKIYQLQTVTYGTASAPYLATKVLQQLALDEGKDFPMASTAVLQDFYMDDCLFGSSNLKECLNLQLELTQLLQRGGMNLHKWCSNEGSTTELQEFPLDRNSEEIVVKKLGMLWNSSSDSFMYKVSNNPNRNFTKRDVLSEIARIYDPLGLLGPVISKAKIFMQQLWLLKLDWNETLPPEIAEQWYNFVKTFPELLSIQVPRCILKSDTKSVILQGFSDASSKSYGAVIYVKLFPKPTK